MHNVLQRRQFAAVAAGWAAATVPFITPRHAQAQIVEGGSIIVGQSAALSGPWEGVGKLLRAGARLAFEEVNANLNAGIGRRKIELHTLDDGYNPKRSIANTQRLLNSNVFALFGYTGTAPSLAAIPLATQARVPFFAPFTGARELRQPFNRLVFHVRASYDEEIENMVRQLGQLGMTRLALLHRGDAFGQAVTESATTALAQRGMQPVAISIPTADSSDMTGTLETLLAAQPQAIVQANTTAASASFVRAARHAGYAGMFYHPSIVGAEALATALGKTAAGIVVSQIVSSPYKNTHMLTRDFLAAIEAHGQGQIRPNYLSLEGYLSARVFIEGVRNAHQQSGGKLTREALVYGLESIKKRVADVAITYSSDNHEGSRFVEMSMLTGDGRVRV